MIDLLAQLWLAEPTASDIAAAHDSLGLPSASTAELAEAFVEAFVLGVPPYASIFTEHWAELNGDLAGWIDGRYRANGFPIPSGLAVAGPDHLGLWLAYLAAEGQHDDAARTVLLDWAPVCCHAVEQEPAAHPFYVALAQKTRTLLASWVDGSGSSTREVDQLDDVIPLLTHPTSDDDLIAQLADPEAEVRLVDLVRFFVAPARCGAYLSRAWWGRTANNLGLALPFGSRLEVATAVLSQAGESEMTEKVLGRLDDALATWQTAYSAWAEGGQWGHASAQPWKMRVANGRAAIQAMRAQLTLR